MNSLRIIKFARGYKVAVKLAPKPAITPKFKEVVKVPLPPPAEPEKAAPSAETSISKDTIKNTPVATPATTVVSPSFDLDPAPMVIPSSVDWTCSYHGISAKPFSREVQEILMAPIPAEDIEVLTENNGLLYLPEIKYRRILNKAFGPGGWGLVPRGPHSILDNNAATSAIKKTVQQDEDHAHDELFKTTSTFTGTTSKILTREYALIVDSRFISQARGEQVFFTRDGIATACEGVKSNALMRCCKDLGVASELWDPAFIRKWKAEFCEEVWVTDVRTKQKRKILKKKGTKAPYPYQQ